MVHSFSFPKSEHLCLKSTFNKLFESGKSIQTNGLKLIWIVTNRDNYKAEVAITVSKRNFKRAVHRNLLKRKIKEAYRLHKVSIQEILNELKLSISFIFIYSRKELSDYNEIEENVIHSLLKLEHELRKWKQNNTNDSLAIKNGSDTVD